MTEITPKHGDMSSLEVEFAHTISFSANAKVKGIFERTRISKDGLIRIKEVAPYTLRIYELKNLLVLMKGMYDKKYGVLDKDGKHIGKLNLDKAKGRTWFTLSSRDVLKFIKDRTDLERRKRLYNSFVRLSQLTVVTYDRSSGYELANKTQHIYDVKASLDYEEIKVEVSNDFIISNLAGKHAVSFNLAKAMEATTDRGFLLYIFMQQQRHPHKEGSKKRLYNKYIAEDSLFQALDLNEVSRADVRRYELKKAWAEFEAMTGLSYKIYITKQDEVVYKLQNAVTKRIKK